MKFIRFRKIKGGYPLTCAWCHSEIKDNTHYIQNRTKKYYLHEACAPEIIWDKVEHTLVDNYDRLQLEKVV